MRNPFKFGGKVSGYQFYDRKESFAKLRRRLLDGASNIVMTAPRRYGKTSLVARVLESLQREAGIRSILFDLSKVPTLARFCEEYVNAVLAAIGGAESLVHRVLACLANCDPTISVNVGVLRISLKFKSALTESSISEVLDLPEKLLAEGNGGSLVVAFDEFQEVAELSKDFALEKIFRSCIQAHQHVRYVFLGSKTHLLERMFADKSRPFYRSALQMPIGKPPPEESREFLRSRFADAGILIADSAIDALLAASDNIPFYLQAFASLVFERVTDADEQEVKVGDIAAAGEELVEINAAYFSELLAGLSGSQRILMEALAREPVQEFSEEYRIRHDLPTLSTVHSALRELIKDGHVESSEGVHRIADPILVCYLQTSSAHVY